jgi:hypothetical protein
MVVRQAKRKLSSCPKSWVLGPHTISFGATRALRIRARSSFNRKNHQNSLRSVCRLDHRWPQRSAQHQCVLPKRGSGQHQCSICRATPPPQCVVPLHHWPRNGGTRINPSPKSFNTLPMSCGVPRLPHPGTACTNRIAQTDCKLRSGVSPAVSIPSCSTHPSHTASLSFRRAHQTAPSSIVGCISSGSPCHA